MRLPDWPERLADMVAAWRQQPFMWGEADCALFAAAAVEACRGHNPAAHWRGHYHSGRSAYRLLRTRGFQTLADAVDATLGPRLPPVLARRGDVVALARAAGLALGVCQGGVALFPAKGAGLEAVPMTEVFTAWRV